MPQTKPNRLFLQITLAFTFVLVGLLSIISAFDPLGTFSAAGNSPADLTPDWWQVYFTDPGQINSAPQWEESLGAVIVDMIEGAERSIYIAGFEFNLTPVAEALIKAQQRGVDVRWVTDDEYGLGVDEDPGRGQFAMLKMAGIQVRNDARTGLMHNKFMVIDGKRVWTGSTNFTSNGIFRNNNNTIVIHDAALARIYETEFIEMWAGDYGPNSATNTDRQYVDIHGTPVQVLFGPEDDVIAWLVPLVEQAQNNIRFMAFAFTDDTLGEALVERSQAGVDVRGIFETRGSETEFSEMGYLLCEGIRIRQDGNPGTFHHKVIVVDDRYILTGSFNFSNNANTKNDENALMIANPEIARQYLEEFNRRWLEAKDPNPSTTRCR